ncbi:MAG: efflux transporter outer membrane subunit [Flavobacteriales bacterium]|nr:efflux transporter outer membrane subunit [Flavobacteriales bacterium]
MKKLIYKIPVLILLATLGFQSCKVGPDYERTELASMDSYNYDSLKQDTVINVRWWELFQDTTLQILINVGLKENLDVLTATSRIEEARAYHGFKKADIWPAFGYNLGTGSRNDIQIPGLSGTTFNNYNASLTVSWELDFWGKFRRASESAKADLLGSEASKRTIMISLISEIAETYFQMLDFQKRLEVSHETYDARKKSVDLMQAKFDHGYIQLLDLNQSQIQLAIAEASIPRYEREFIRSQHKLSLLLGKTPRSIQTGLKLDSMIVPPAIPVGLPSHLIERRPDIIQSEFAVVSANAQVGVAVAQRFPAISLTGGGGLGSSDVNSLLSNGFVWSVGAALTGPLFNFGKNKRRVEVEKHKTEQAVYAYRKTVLNAFRGVEDALVGVRTFKVEYDARSHQVEAAESALGLSEMRYDKGVTSYLEVLEQQRQHFESQLAESQAHQEFLTSYVKLYKELGGGWISQEEEEAAKQAEAENKQ